MATVEEQIALLQAQQAWQTKAIAAILADNYQAGAESAKGCLVALNPDLYTDLAVVEKQNAGKAEPPNGGDDWWGAFQGNRDLYMAPQQRDWTCSICAATWLLQATEIAPDAVRDEVGYALGYPACVNEAYGLMSVECMVDLFASAYDTPARWEWVDWDRLYALATSTAGVLSGGAWYHWVAIRGTDGPTIWIANSAEGYKGVYSTLSRAQFDALGPFKVVYLVH